MNKFTKDKIEDKLSELECMVSDSVSDGNRTVEVINTPIDTSQFEEINSEDILKILGLTIMQDNTNKLITFYALLSVYTDNSQINVSFNAPSSSGKSYIPLEVSNLFPKQDIMILGSASATAFYHEQGVYDKENNIIHVDLSKKIIIFLDQPSTQLLAKLRALLSHDQKEITAKITDKNQKGGNRTKTVVIKGYPVVIFCTAGLNLDEQEATRFLLLSPEINSQKIQEAVISKISKESNPLAYRSELESEPNRRKLIQRVKAIKQENITDVLVPNIELVQKMFLERVKHLKPRHQRDIGRILSLIKVHALMNLWFRERDGDFVCANDQDIMSSFSLYDLISQSQELNLPPYVLNIYTNIIWPLYNKKAKMSGCFVGVTRQEIQKEHYKIHGRHIPDWQLRGEVLRSLENSGLITQEQNPTDKRQTVVVPTMDAELSTDENNNKVSGGVIPDVFNETKVEGVDELLGQFIK